MDIYKNPNFNSLVPLPDVLVNLTFLSIAGRIPNNCTNHCAPAADFLGYIKGSFDVKTLTEIADIPPSKIGTLFDVNKLKDEGDVPLSKFSTLMRSCTPPGLLDDVSNGQIIDWYFKRTMSEENDFVWITIITLLGCFPEFCNALTWEGNPDISGIGVMIAFIIQAGLTAVFLFIYTSFWITETCRIRKNPAKANQYAPSLWRKAVDDCLEVFWSTCYVFALTLAVGTLCFNVIYHSPGHVYSGYFGYLGTVLSVSVLVCLWPWYPGRYQYPRLTLCSILVLLLLVIGVSLTFVREVNSGDKTVFEKLCLETSFDMKRVASFEHIQDAFQNAKSITYVQNFVKYTPYGTLALALLWVGALALIQIWRKKITRWKLYKFTTGILSFLLVAGSFGLIGLSLSTFIYLRKEVQELAGETYADNEWGFGQFVAIIAWFPLVAQILMIFFRGISKDTRYQKHFHPLPESERYAHYILAQSPTADSPYPHGTDTEKQPVTSVTQQDITDAWHR
ncbi:hypothetical protein B0T20DRAFT_98518 [Sordaria brevicollis]|uniref:Uncharacterized protein n=1 Tax=Sordaria brevicollis TaxID=83679 RepID=A0AAE0NW81_SORBR|nr:hypothetical protein B0T20DRAFT_98518 [Sordaria brevicollis]